MPGAVASMVVGLGLPLLVGLRLHSLRCLITGMSLAYSICLLGSWLKMTRDLAKDLCQIPGMLRNLTWSVTQGQGQGGPLTCVRHVFLASWVTGTAEVIQ